jgi:hypothetical protein
MALMSTLRAISVDPRGSLCRTARFGMVRIAWELTIGPAGARSENIAVEVKLDEILNGDC